MPNPEHPRVVFKSEVIRAFCNPGVFIELNTAKATPSNRTNPSKVPIHKYPSRVCTIAVTEFKSCPPAEGHASKKYLESSAGEAAFNSPPANRRLSNPIPTMMPVHAPGQFALVQWVMQPIIRTYPQLATFLALSEPQICRKNGRHDDSGG
jgi:hypothetical protein